MSCRVVGVVFAGVLEWLPCRLWRLLLVVVVACAVSLSLRAEGEEEEGLPLLILGGEVGNSSATCAGDIDEIFPRLRQLELNTVLVPAYWELIEPTEGSYDFTLPDHILSAARANDLKVIFLWFGAWKNSMSCYAPPWFKADYERFPRARTAVGQPLEIASAFSEAVLRADSTAFTAFVRHLSEVDAADGTVLMIQVENEIGMLDAARDYSAAATAAYCSAVPSSLTSYLSAHATTLHPWLSRRWEEYGNKTSGTWAELFGDDDYGAEVFMAWYYARYVETLTSAAKAIYDIPYYVNAAMNSRGRRPGAYPSAGPLAHLIDIWHAGAPSLSFLAPDLYDSGFAAWVAQYHLWNNPLFIPEVQRSRDNAAQAFYVFGAHDAIGFSPFSIEDDDGSTLLPEAYRALRALSPLLSRHDGVRYGILVDEEHPDTLLTDGSLTLSCHHYLTLPWDRRGRDGTPWQQGGAIIIKLGPDDYLLAGTGVVVTFLTTEEQEYALQQTVRGEDGFALAGDSVSAGDAVPFSARRKGLSLVEEVAIADDGTLVPLRRQNGDQTHQGRHVRISIDDVKILHVRLYDYQ